MDWLETLCLRPRVGALLLAASIAFAWWQQSLAAGVFVAALVLLACQWSMVVLHIFVSEMDARAAHLDSEKDY